MVMNALKESHKHKPHHPGQQLEFTP